MIDYANDDVIHRRVDETRMNDLFKREMLIMQTMMLFTEELTRRGTLKGTGTDWYIRLYCHTYHW